MTNPKSQSDWAKLFRVACALIRQVNSEKTIIDGWTFGGGTALMLQIGHRESHDVDIFLPDPQFLPFLDPKKRDFKFEVAPTDYDGDGAHFLKLGFESIGEIDFIVASPKTDSPTIKKRVEGEDILLETIPEIIAKKVFYRGASLQPRDIFDIAAAGEAHAAEVVAGLTSHKDKVTAALAAIEKQNPEFINGGIASLQIRPAFTNVAKTAIERAKKVLRSI